MLLHHDSGFIRTLPNRPLMGRHQTKSKPHDFPFMLPTTNNDAHYIHMLCHKRRYSLLPTYPIARILLGLLYREVRDEAVFIYLRCFRTSPPHMLHLWHHLHQRPHLGVLTIRCYKLNKFHGFIHPVRMHRIFIHHITLLQYAQSSGIRQ